MRLPPRTSSSVAGPPPSWPPVLATRGPGGESARHAHHAMHLVLSHDGTLRVEAGGASRRVPGVLTAPDVRHAIDGRRSEVTLVFLDPESDAGERLRATLRGPVRFLTGEERDEILRGCDPELIMRTGGAAWIDSVVRTLGGAPTGRRRLHPRVRQLLRHLSTLPASADTSLEVLAATVRLSPGRLMHVFTEAIGIPLRPYLAWLRLQRAAVAILSGLPFGQAATLAGFADAAHMTRSFRRMFGTTPSAIRSMAASSFKRSSPNDRRLPA